MYCIDENTIKDMRESGYFLQRTHGRKLMSELHAHAFYEFLFVICGSCVHERDGVRESLMAGDFVCVIPDIAHRFLSQSEDCDIVAMSVTTDEVALFFTIYGKEAFLFEKIRVGHISFEQQKSFVTQYENREKADVKEQTLFNRVLLNQFLLLLLTASSEDERMPSEFATVVEQMQDPKYFAEGVTAFLRLSGYSHSQLCRLTKRYLKATPTEYVNCTKMKYAYEMVVNTDMDYETICAEIGFESYGWFCKLFKKTFGYTVATARKRNSHAKETV